MNLYSFLPSDFSQWIGFLVMIVGGVVASFYLFDKEKRKRKREADVADDRLINILEKTVDKLSHEVISLREQQNTNIKEIATLQGQNKTLTEILQGRDKDSIKFQEEGFKSFAMIMAMGTNLEKLAISLDKHMKVIEQKI